MNLSLLGWYGVVLVLCIPNRRHTSNTTFDPKFVPWSLCSSRKAPYRATISYTSFLATVVAFWSGMGKHSSHLASHHEAVLVPCRGDKVGTGDVHRQAFHRNPDDVLVQRLPSSPSFLQHCAVAFVADPAHVSSHSGPVETLFRQRQGACRAQMGSDHPSMEQLEKTAASIRRDDQQGPPSLSFVEPSVQYSAYQV